LGGVAGVMADPMLATRWAFGDFYFRAVKDMAGSANG
jgi:hypothetical protein